MQLCIFFSNVAGSVPTPLLHGVASYVVLFVLVWSFFAAVKVDTWVPLLQNFRNLVITISFIIIEIDENIDVNVLGVSFCKDEWVWN